MKKLMFAIAAVTAGVAVADLTSANVVGYMQSTNLEGLNYVAPTFIKINGQKVTNLQDIQMAADVESDTTELHVLSDGQMTAETYYWFKNRSKDNKVGPAGYRIDVVSGTNGQWFRYYEDEDEYVHTTDREFTWGECVELSTYEDAAETFSGAVCDDDVLFADDSACLEGLNYFGNPYPADLDIQGVQMAADVESDTTELHVLEDGQMTAETYYWFKNRSKDNKVGPSGYRVDVVPGTNGQWFRYYEDEDEYVWCDPSSEEAKKVFSAGAGFEISTFEGAGVTMVAPFDL